MKWLILAIILTGCNTKPVNPCPYGKVKMADISHHYKECKGLDYEKSVSPTIGN